MESFCLAIYDEHRQGADRRVSTADGGLRSEATPSHPARRTSTRRAGGGFLSNSTQGINMNGKILLYAIGLTAGLPGLIDLLTQIFW